MITWRRLGFLGFMIPLAIWGLASVIWGFQNDRAIRIAMILAAVIVWFVGVKLNAEGPDDDGKALHLAFGFPMQWSALLAIGAFFLTFR